MTTASPSAGSVPAAPTPGASKSAGSVSQTSVSAAADPATSASSAPGLNKSVPGATASGTPGLNGSVSATSVSAGSVATGSVSGVPASMPASMPASIAAAAQEPASAAGRHLAADVRRGWQGPRVGGLAKGLLGAVPLAVLVLVWHLLTVNQVVFWLRFDKIPAPAQVFDSFVAQLSSGTYHTDLLASLRRILTGFGLAAVAGVTLGVAVGRSRVARTALRPLIEVFRPIPAIALVPLSILLFPTGEQGIVFITFFAAFFPVAVSTIHAMHALPRVWEEAARTMGAGRLSVLTHVVLPGAMPGIFSGLSVSMGVAWICVISAEMISGQFGIGYYTWQSYGLLDYAGVMVGMISIGALGWSTAWLVERVGRRVNRWLPRAAR